MRKISFKKIAKVASLIDFEIERVEKMKQRSTQSSLATTATSLAFNQEADGADNMYSDEVARYQREIDFLKDIKRDYDEELDQLSLMFGAREKDEHKEKQNGGN